MLSRAVAGLPPGQRHAVTLFYYADQPAGQIAGTPGAAKASLHKARRRLREYITAHRPDLIPATSRRIPMTAVRIAHADPWPGRPARRGHVLVSSPTTLATGRCRSGSAAMTPSSGACSAAPTTTTRRTPTMIMPRR